MHNERETVGIECGTDQYGDNVRGNKISETLRSKLSKGLQKILQQRPGWERLMMC